MFIEIPQSLKKLSKFFPENLYVVGGYVRNKLLKIAATDIDLASSASIEEVAKRLENSPFEVKIKNLKLGAIEILCGGDVFEYTSFRKEKYADDGRHSPISVERTLDIKEDSVRRDFSINSIYYNINKDEIVDFYHGIVDTKQRLIRCNINPEEVLKFDGERILRMVRIAGELDFKIEKNTFSAAVRHVENIANLHGARKFREIKKILNCDKRYGQSKHALKNALKLLNKLGVWQAFGLKSKKIKYKMVKKSEDRFLGLLIDIVDSEKPECLQAFLEGFLAKQFAFDQEAASYVFERLAGFYNALAGMKNKEYFFKYFSVWADVYALLKKKSKRVLSRYNFFYQYIIEHALVMEVSQLAVEEEDLRKAFPSIDEKNFDKILKRLLSKVFDGKVANNKKCLLEDVEKNLKNY